MCSGLSAVTEHAEAVEFMKMCHLHRGKHPALARIFHVPNGGKRNVRTAQRLKAEGVKAGVPDYLLPEPRGEFSGLAIELKRAKGGRPSDSQLDWLDYLESVGWRVGICEGWGEAWDMSLAYVELPAKNIGVSNEG